MKTEETGFRELRFSGRQARDRRTHLGLSPTAVAAATGVSTATLHNWEAGRSTPDANVVRRLARALKTDVDKLYEPAGDAGEPIESLA